MAAADRSPAVPVPTPDQRRAVLAATLGEVLRTTPATGHTHEPGMEDWNHHVGEGRPGHDGYYAGCALCRRDLAALVPALVAAVERTVGGELKQAGRRRTRITPERLAEVASVYRAAEDRGVSPTVAVADRFGKPHSTAAKWVAHARRGGYLPPASEAVNEAARHAAKSAGGGTR